MRPLSAFSLAALAVLALSACGPKASTTPQPAGGAAGRLGAAAGTTNGARVNLGANTGANATANAGASQETPEQLRARAEAAEAEVRRLRDQANAAQGNTGGAGGGDTGGGSGGGGAMDGSHTLGASNQKLNSGQYYETVTFQADPGQLYQLDYNTQGYTAAVVVLNADNQVVSRTFAGPRSANRISDDIRPDSAGAWHILLTSTEPGVTGQFTVQLVKMTERSLN